MTTAVEPNWKRIAQFVPSFSPIPGRPTVELVSCDVWGASPRLYFLYFSVSAQGESHVLFC
jgi:hypothetical protein